VAERVRIPADTGQPDRNLAGLTARQLGILVLAGLPAGLLFLAARPLLPLPVAAGLAAPPLLVGVALALGRRDGVSLDRLAVAAVAQRLGPRRLVPVPGGARRWRWSVTIWSGMGRVCRNRTCQAGTPRSTGTSARLPDLTTSRARDRSHSKFSKTRDQNSLAGCYSQ
jgi:PrgI family protein